VDDAARHRVNEWIGGKERPGAGERICALHPGGLRAEKKWPAERYAEASARVRDLGCGVCIVGSVEERDEAEEIRVRAGSRGIANAAGEFSLGETAALLERSAFLLSNDTGVMHLATAVDTPVIALCGPMDHEAVGPRSGRAKVLSGNGDVATLSVEDVMREVSAFAGVRE
jgi:heptosyltransferase-2